MSGLIPGDKISEIQNSVDIVDVISESVLLKQAGKNFQGLCPFHSEKTPSFSVSREKQIYYCFGCGTGGNVFNFLMKHDGLNFVEAVKLLARRAGIEIPDREMSPEMKARIRERERIFAVNKAASGFFRRNLHGPGGRPAKKYLKGRGFDDRVIDDFQLGYAPRGWDHLVGFLTKKKERLETAEKAGLIAQRPSGNGYYDRFRDRVVFPIINPRNQVVGFGGRVMDDSLPKYLNSPETPVFNKRKSLYGLNLTKIACRESETVFVVEGYMDLIALHQHGIRNVAATLGTSLTPDHARLLKGFVKKAILVFDSDEAGTKAALRSLPLFRRENLDTRVMSLPKGHDPDSFVFESGAEAFKEAADKAPGAMAFLTEIAVARHGMSVEGKLAVLEDMKGPLVEVRDPAARSLYIKELGERLGIDEDAVLESVSIASSKKDKNKRSSEKAPPPAHGPEPPGRERTVLRNRPIFRTEKKIVSMMLQCPEMLPDIVTYNVLDYFEDENLKSIGKAILLDFDEEGPARTDPSELFVHLENEAQKGLAASLAMDDEDYWLESGDRKRQLIFQFIESGRVRNERELMEQIKDAEARNDVESLNELLKRLQKMALAGQEQKTALLKTASSIHSLD